jgi:GntR family transcriptional regulator / MocR family aminotransferase
MPVEWSGLGPELTLSVDRSAGQALRGQLEDQLRDAIRGGRLQSGERLPSTRTLARELGLSRGLVQDCYAQLLAEGYLTAHGGSATRVAPFAGTQAAPAPARPAAAPRLLADFQAGLPDLASFPRADWLTALRAACAAMPTASFGYDEPRGSRQLREVLAAYLRRVRAAAADPERIVICAGFGQGLGVALRALAATGVRRVGFEDPGYADTSESAAAFAGVEAVPVPVDADGIDVGALAAADVGAVVVTPAHQWPSGVVLGPGRRRELAAWAARTGSTIIEDDYDAEFRYDRDPVGALQGIAADRVMYLGTASKSLAPSVRLGWMLCPPGLIGAVIEQKRRSDRGSPGLDQLALATMIQSGRFDRQLRRMRAVYAARRDALVGALTEHAPRVRLTGLAAGFHAVAHLPAPGAEHEVIAAARARSVGLYGMSQYRSTGAAEPAQLVLGFGNIGERQIRAGIAAVGDLLDGPPLRLS